MLTIISGTNRIGSRTLQVAQHYFQYTKQHNVDVRLFSLEQLHSLSRNEDLIKIEQEILIPSEKFIFIVPEYNGSFPGILKLLIDISDIRKCWWHKKALITGVADGRAGNLRGLEHLTNIFHYLKMNVYFDKIPISKINDELDQNGNWTNDLTPQVIQNQIKGFLEY